MKNLFSFLIITAFSFHAAGQPPAHVDKKTKEFIIPPDSKTDFTIIGYQYPNNTTKKMICFSTNASVVSEDNAECVLGAYFDTNRLKEGDTIFYLGVAGSFAKMNFIHGNGKKTIFYIPKSSFVIK
jgi:hypothetical protein